MKLTQRTPVPLPGAKTKSKAPATSSTARLSQEFVDSDDDSLVANGPDADTLEKPKTTIAIHRPNGKEKSKPESQPSKKVSRTLQPAKSVSQPAVKSSASHAQPAPEQPAVEDKTSQSSSSEENSDSDSDSDSDSETSVGKTPTRALDNGHALRRSESEGDSSSVSSSDASDTDKNTSSNERSARE